MDDRVQAEVAKIIAADSDPKIELEMPEGCEVHFLGRPILALDPRMNNSTVRHVFLATLSLRIVSVFRCRVIYGMRFSTGLGPRCSMLKPVDFEDTLGEICGDHSFRVGFCAVAHSFITSCVVHQVYGCRRKWLGRPILMPIKRNSTR